MSGWGGGDAGKRPETMRDPDGPSKNKLATPPACPRCELTKSQFNRTILNYQKAYRKKVEGLKAELRSARNDKTQLQKQVKQLKSITRVHIPSVIVGAAIGYIARMLLSRSRKAQAAGAGKKKTADEAEQTVTAQEETAAEDANSFIEA